MPNAALGRGLEAGPVVAQVVQVRAVEHDREPAPSRLGHADGEQVVLAEVAAVGRVLRVAGDGELVRVDQEMRHAEPRRQLLRRREVLRRHGRRDGGERQAALAEHVVGDAQEEARVDAAREGDQRGGQVGEQPAQPVELGGELHQIPSA